MIKITSRIDSKHIVTALTIQQNTSLIKQKRGVEIFPGNSGTTTQIIDGLSTIHERYHGFLIDAWGVLHDGNSLYPHALECMLKLHEYDKKIIILSNAVRRLGAMVEELRTHKILPEYYYGVLSSGELTWKAMHQADWPWKHGYYLGPQRSRGITAGLALEWVSEIRRADFILNTGAASDNPPDTSAYEDLLAKAASLDIPMICANPDLVAIRDGKPGICAGALAKRYQQLGASQIIYYGKPYAPIYREAMSLLQLPASQVLAIGDAFATDIRGARQAGLDTCMIATGIHRDDLLPLSIESLQTVAPADAIPNYLSKYLAW
ncbi:MAG: TIGR01459 family HAD-type hydrolase [Gammaproteobacteria bacterium]|nr:TIGR01459 family HAD-type hydrolase [Gammaproteobacteria bacterium]